MKGAALALAADRLDDPELVEAADPGDVLRQVASSAAQVRASLRTCAESGIDALRPDHRPRAVVVAGSVLAGELLGAVAGPGTPVPVVPVRGYQLPGWVGAADLVIAVPGAEQTLVTEAARRGCQLAVISGEGTQLQRVAEQGRALFVAVSNGAPGRAGLWPVAVPLVRIAERLGIARVGEDGYEAAARAMEDVSHQCRPASESFVNPGKSLALDLAGTLPLIWGGSALAGVVARRFVSQLSLNARYPAVAGMLPEAARDQAAAFDGPFAPGQEPDFPDAEFPDEGFGDAEDTPGLDLDNGPAPLRLVLIADPISEPQQLTKLREAAGDLAEQRGLAVSRLGAEGDQPLRRLAGLVQLTDYATVYLGIASGFDPAAAPAVQDLAERTVLHRCAFVLRRVDESRNCRVRH